MILMIDNYDSFTWNLVQYLGELGVDVRVFRNDEIAAADIAAMKPSGIVISPGPCTPAQAGISLAAVREFAGRVPGLSRLKGRYLNGSGGLNVALADHRLVVMLQSLEASGQSPPPQILTQLQSLNLAQNVMGDAQTAELIGRLESIEVKDGAITIKTRAKE